MKLQKPAQELLAKIYRDYQETGELEYGFLYSEAPEEKQREIRTIGQLVLAGFVDEIAPATGYTEIKLTREGIEYFEEITSPQPQVINFNVSGNVENSILGNQTSAAIHIGSDLAQIETLISGISGPDRKLLDSLPRELSDIQKSKDVKSGALAKFNSTLTKYPKLFDAVGALLTKLALGLIP